MSDAQLYQCFMPILLVICFGDKKIVWDTWMNFDDITTAFCALAATPDVSAIDNWMERLEQFVTLFCAKNQSIRNSKQLFIQNDRAIDGLLPPTPAALIAQKVLPTNLVTAGDK